MYAPKDLGGSAEGAKIGEEAVKVATRVLDKSPAHMGAIRSRALLASGLARTSLWARRPRRALAMPETPTRDWENLVRADPGNTIAWNNLFVSRNWQAWARRGAGDLEGGVAVFKDSLEIEKRAPPSSYLFGNLGFQTVWRAI